MGARERSDAKSRGDGAVFTENNTLGAAAGKALPAAAVRALEEAAGRRAVTAQSTSNTAQPERGGPDGPDQTRDVDWERAGRAIDFS